MKNSVLKKLIYRCSLLYTVTIMLFLISSIPVCAITTLKSTDSTFINKKKQGESKLWSWKPDSVIVLSKQTLPLHVEIANPVEEIDELRNLGVTHFEKGEYHQSVRQYRKAIALAHINHLLIKKAQAMNEISRPLTALGSHNTALSYLSIAWSIVRQTENDRDIALNIYNTAFVYFCQLKMKQAIFKYKKSLTIYKAIGDTSNMPFILANIGHICLYNHQYKLAKTYYSSSLKYAQQLKNKKAIANVLCALGNLNSELGQLDKAMVYHLQAKNLLEQLGEKNEYLQVLHTMTKTYFKQKKIYQALHFAKLNYQMATKQQHMYFKGTSAALLSKLYEEKGQAKLALTYYKIYKSAQDSLYGASNKEQLVHFTQKYIFEKKQRQLDREYQKHLYEKQTQVYMACISGFFLIIISTLLLTAIKQKKKVNRTLMFAKQEIEKQNSSLKKSNAFKKQLLSVMAHDIRTPLANAKMILSLFDRKHVSKQHLQKLIQSSQIEIDSLIMLLDNLLHWITFQLRTQKIVKNYFSLEEITAETFSLFRRQAAEKEVQLSMHISDNLEIYGDIESLKTVLRNLVNNAIKFSRKRGIVTVTSEYNKITHQTTIRIIDTGIGMSPSELDNLLKKPGYSQEGTQHEKGTGIGLHLCFQYISLNNSQLLIKSSLENGTEIWFNLKGRIASQDMPLVCIPAQV